MLCFIIIFRLYTFTISTIKVVCTFAELINCHPYVYNKPCELKIIIKRLKYSRTRHKSAKVQTIKMVEIVNVYNLN